MSSHSHSKALRRRVVAAIERAGGTVSTTRRGHLKVRGPGGNVTIAAGAAPGDRRGMLNAAAELRRHAGLHVRLI